MCVPGATFSGELSSVCEIQAPGISRHGNSPVEMQCGSEESWEIKMLELGYLQSLFIARILAFYVHISVDARQHKNILSGCLHSKLQDLIF